MIEIIRPHPAARPQLAVFDFDGTLSLVRSGWQQIMADLMLEELGQAPPHEPPADRERAVRHFIAHSTGQPTLGQMAWLTAEVARRGGAAATPEEYKRRFEQRLRVRIDRRIAGLSRGAAPEALLVPGARELLGALRRLDLPLALISGTDREDVLREASLLQIAGYFDGRIYGPGPHSPSFSKPAAIAQLLDEYGAPGAALLGFGDGPVETAAVCAVGGLAIGVALDEARGAGLDLAKRAALIAAGAGIIVAHFGEHARLVDTIF